MSVDEGDGIIRYYSRKISPISINVGLSQSRISGTMDGYSSNLFVTSDNPARVNARTAVNGLIVDSIDQVSAAIRGVAVGRLVTERRRIRVVIGSDWFSVGGRFGMFYAGANNLPILQPASANPEALLQLGGYVSEAGAAAGMPYWMDIPGSVVEMPINGAAVPVGSSVYVSETGIPTLFPETLSRKIGVTLESRYNCRVRMEFSEELVAKQMPTQGTFPAGTLVRNLNPTISGPVGGRYVLTGWRRVSTGSGNVLWTDWVERREPTGG